MSIESLWPDDEPAPRFRFVLKMHPLGQPLYNVAIKYDDDIITRAEQSRAEMLAAIKKAGEQ